MPDSSSLRTTQGLTIIVMGLIGVLLALATGEIYHRLTLANQRDAFRALIRLETQDLLKDLESKSRDVGLHLQRDPRFRNDFNGRNLAAIKRHLDNQFHQYFVTAHVLRLESLQIFDLDFNLVARSGEGAFDIADRRPVCPELMERATRRTGAQRLKPIAALCALESRAYYVVVVPIGGLRPLGYIAVVTDPIHSLAAVESTLGMPLKILRPNAEVAVESKAWPRAEAEQKWLVADVSLFTDRGDPALTLAVANDVHALQVRLTNTRYLIVLVTGLVTAIATIGALFILQKTALGPLATLKQHMLLQRSDRRRLGEPIHVGGNAEIEDLAQGFNEFGMELKSLYHTLEEMAYTDVLTELPNRAHFNLALEGLASRDLPFALFLVDLDRFKEINDTLGHDIGDQLLKGVGARLKGVMRHSDMLVRVDDEMAAEVNGHVLARLGGDEFAVVLPRVATCDDATTVAEKLLRALDRPFIVENHTLYVRMSIGMALYPEHGQDALTLFRQADVAMYHAKQNGLGYAFFNRAHHQERLASAELERELHQAIDLGNLELYYQPKINVKDGSVCGAEALLRWRHPQKGVIAPDKFIPLAEQSGLIHPLTTWVLNRAIEDCASWHRAGIAAGVAINISAVNLRDPQFVEHVEATLNRCQLPPGLVTLELTESAVMREPNHSLLVMTRLDQMGVRLSIDDFGTGYSSLSYLKQLPVDEIKIDRSFVMEMNSNGSDSVIVRATIDLAHNMGLRVVAEGVENRETLLVLSRLGCDLAQGYFISHPIPCDALVTWITTVKSCYTNPDRDCSAPGDACFPACG